MGTFGETIGFCGIVDANLIIGRLCSGLALRLSSRQRVDQRNNADEIDFCEWRFSLEGLSQTIHLTVDDDGSAVLSLERLDDDEKQSVFGCLSSDPELENSIIG